MSDALQGLLAQLACASERADPANPAQRYGADDVCLPWADLPALLAEFAASRGLQDWRAGLPEDSAALSPQQLLALLGGLQARARDAVFAIGQLMLPGHYGLASQALQQACHLEAALHCLARHAGRLSPLLCPRPLRLGGELILVWSEACGCPPALRPMLVDLHMTAVVAMAQWLGGTPPTAWRLCFNRTAPADLSLHASYLGPGLRFGAPVDAMRIPLSEAHRPWSGARSAWAQDALARGADAQAGRRGELALLHDWLLPRASAQPSLGEAAAAFGLSPATLKRRLARQHSHYQAELDRVRALLALYLMDGLGQRSAEVAPQLGFGETSNFRRAFRRWTGLMPA